MATYHCFFERYSVTFHLIPYSFPGGRSALSFPIISSDNADISSPVPPFYGPPYNDFVKFLQNHHLSFVITCHCFLANFLATYSPNYHYVLILDNTFELARPFCTILLWLHTTLKLFLHPCLLRVSRNALKAFNFRFSRVQESLSFSWLARYTYCYYTTI